MNAAETLKALLADAREEAAKLRIENTRLVGWNLRASKLLTEAVKAAEDGKTHAGLCKGRETQRRDDTCWRLDAEALLRESAPAADNAAVGTVDLAAENTRLVEAMRSALVSADVALRALETARGTRSATAVAQTGVAVLTARSQLAAAVAHLLGALPPASDNAALSGYLGAKP